MNNYSHIHYNTWWNTLLALSVYLLLHALRTSDRFVFFVCCYRSFSSSLQQGGGGPCFPVRFQHTTVLAAAAWPNACGFVCEFLSPLGCLFCSSGCFCSNHFLFPKPFWFVIFWKLKISTHDLLVLRWCTNWLNFFIWTYKIKWYKDYNLHILEKTKR